MNVCVSVDALNSVIKALRCYRENIGNIANDVINWLYIVCGKCEKEIEVKKRELDEKELQIKNIKAELKTYEEHMQAEKSRLEEIERTRTSMGLESASLGSHLGSSTVSEDERARIEAEIRSVDDGIAALGQESVSVRSTIANLSSDIDKCKEKIKSMENERDIIKEKWMRMTEVLNKYRDAALSYELAIKSYVANACEIAGNAEKGVIGCRDCIVKYENVKLY